MGSMSSLLSIIFFRGVHKLLINQSCWIRKVYQSHRKSNITHCFKWNKLMQRYINFQCGISYKCKSFTTQNADSSKSSDLL